MKTLNITLTVLANNYNDADKRGQEELMELVKRIGMSSGSSVASCEGDTNHLEGNKYEVYANVKLNGTGNINKVITETQRAWNDKFDIIGCLMFVTEEQKSEPVQKPRDYESVTCESCGQVMVKGYENVINPGTDSEYCLCNMCYEHDEKTIECEYCLNPISADCLAMNPVTGDHDLCPVCGNKL